MFWYRCRQIGIFSFVCVALWGSSLGFTACSPTACSPTALSPTGYYYMVGYRDYDTGNIQLRWSTDMENWEDGIFPQGLYAVPPPHRAEEDGIAVALQNPLRSKVFWLGWEYDLEWEREILRVQHMTGIGPIFGSKFKGEAPHLDIEALTGPVVAPVGNDGFLVAFRTTGWRIAVCFLDERSSPDKWWLTDLAPLHDFNRPDPPIPGRITIHSPAITVLNGKVLLAWNRTDGSDLYFALGDLNLPSIEWTDIYSISYMDNPQMFAGSGNWPEYRMVLTNDGSEFILAIPWYNRYVGIERSKDGLSWSGVSGIFQGHVGHVAMVARGDADNEIDIDDGIDRDDDEIIDRCFIFAVENSLKRYNEAEGLWWCAPRGPSTSLNIFEEGTLVRSTTLSMAYTRD